MNDAIDKYLDGELSGEALTAFERRLDTEPALVEALEIALKARAAVIITARENHRKELRDRYRPAEGQRFNMRLGMGLAVAAAAVLLLFFGLKGSFSSPKTPEQLFAQYYHSQSLSGLRSINNQTYDTWKEAADLYNENAFAQAIPLMERLVSDSLFEEQAKLRFYLAMSYIEVDKCPEAAQVLDLVPEGSAFATYVEWYKALCKLRSGDRDGAIAMLQKINSEKVHIHKKEAKALLIELSE
jgi:cytochrome c-type biogenesis protein CcmH/NrfG